MDLGFPAAARLRKRQEYQKVREEGRRHSGSCLILLVLPHGRGDTRYGITVSRRLGKATVRNRLKRRLREIVRMNRSKMEGGYDLVIIARTPALEAAFGRIREEYLRLARVSRVLKGGKGEGR